MYSESCIIYTYHKSLKYLLTQKELNLKQHRWIELLKNYNCTIEYHPDKANVVADALSCRAMIDLRAMFAHLSLFDDGGWVCIPNNFDQRQLILREAHSSPYAMHPSGNKMYRDLYELYWWPSLERELAKFYISEIVRLYGVPVSIISDRDLHFTSRFWKKLHKALGSRLNLSTAFYPQTDGQSERVIQILKDMLWSYVIDFRDIKSYADLKRRDIKYAVGDFIFLKVSPWKKFLRFDRKGKLSPGFIWPYQILKRMGPVAYQLELPPELAHTYDVFHVSMLMRYQFDPSHVVSVEEIEVRPDLTFEEEPVHILGRDFKVLRRKSIPLVKVLWRNHSTEEVTWEPEDSIRQQYLYMFESVSSVFVCGSVFEYPYVQRNILVYSFSSKLVEEFGLSLDYGKKIWRGSRGRRHFFCDLRTQVALRIWYGRALDKAVIHRHRQFSATEAQW
ncbi:reverse transcriptase [Gossypium australe]|uniref:Reverse transcriptase n=1 Tax=Gossypium australe TaxID=47621 RepID=A0A5B6WI83_9ROSI|nr:reverse transcriptase [Gossypium australe]